MALGSGIGTTTNSSIVHKALRLICDGSMYKAYAMIFSQAGIQTLRLLSAASDKVKMILLRSKGIGSSGRFDPDTSTNNSTVE